MSSKPEKTPHSAAHPQSEPPHARLILRLLCSAYFCLLLFTGSTTALCGDKEIARLAAFHYPPFYYEQDGEVRGIAVDVVNELFERLGMQPEIKMYPLKRGLGNIETGRSDAVMILIKTPERDKYLHFTDPVITVRGLIWSSAEKQGGPVHFERFEDLQPYRIGATRGYSYGNEFDGFLAQANVDTANSDYGNYRKLAAGRIDIFPGNEIVAKGLFKMHPELQGKFVHSENSFMEWTLHMGIGKNSLLASKLPDINRVLSDLITEGFVNRTVGKYTD